jgi:TRAP-type uncharacterized transport system fused permease subunit
VEVIYIIFKACFGIALWGVAIVGFLFAPINLIERLAAFAAGLLLILALPWTDEIGFALGLVLVVWLWWRRQSVQARTAA